MNDPKNMTSEEFQQWNEEMAKKHDPENFHESKSWLVRLIERKRVKAITRLLKAGSDDSVLDVGVGAGNILEKIKSKKRTGVDLSNFLLAKARQRLGDEVKLIEGNAESLTSIVEQKSFDRVYCSEVLEHLQNPDVALNQIAEVMKPDGLAVITVPNEKLIDRLKTILRYTGLNFFLGKPAEHKGDEWHLHDFDKNMLIRLCQDRFVIDRIVAAPSFFLPLHYVALLRLRNSNSSHKSDDGCMENRVKDWWKRFPALYNFLFFLIGPSYISGVSGGKFVRSLPRTAKILCAGSGTTRLAENCVNVDIKKFPGVDVVADITDLPFEENSFDAATCEQVLEHVPNPYKAAEELKRVVRPGGLIHIATPFLFPWHPSPSDYTRWTCEGLQELFRGCAVIKKGVMVGPWSAVTAFTASFLASAFSFGIAPLRIAIQYLAYVLLFPLKFLDILFARLPGAEYCAAGVYVVVCVPE